MDYAGKEISRLFPTPPPDPVYIDFDAVTKNIIIPEVVSRGTVENVESSETNKAKNTLTVERRQSEANTRDTVTLDKESPGPSVLYVADDENVTVDENDDTESVARYNWRFDATKKLLAILIDKKEKDKHFSIGKNLWSSVADAIAKDLKKPFPSAEQCREKCYALKRAYRQFVANSSKTGNKRPKPFLHESEMYTLLNDDPAFRPPVVRSSLGTEINNVDECEASSSQSNGEKPPKRSCTGSRGELIDYLKERDDNFLKTIKEIIKTN